MELFDIVSDTIFKIADLKRSKNLKHVNMAVQCVFHIPD